MSLLSRIKFIGEPLKLSLYTPLYNPGAMEYKDITTPLIYKCKNLLYCEELITNKMIVVDNYIILYNDDKCVIYRINSHFKCEKVRKIEYQITDIIMPYWYLYKWYEMTRDIPNDFHKHMDVLPYIDNLQEIQLLKGSVFKGSNYYKMRLRKGYCSTNTTILFELSKLHIVFNDTLYIAERDLGNGNEPNTAQYYCYDCSSKNWCILEISDK